MARGKMTEKVVDNKPHQPAGTKDREMKIRSLEKAKVRAYAIVHTIRHSYATHMLEAGV